MFKQWFVSTSLLTLLLCDAAVQARPHSAELQAKLKNVRSEFDILREELRTLQKSKQKGNDFGTAPQRGQRRLHYVNNYEHFYWDGKLEGVDKVTDTMWLLICGTFVFFMHAGFAMLEAGTGRSKNVQAILMKNLITVCAGTVGWYLMGWSLAYGGDAQTADSWSDRTFADCDFGHSEFDENPMGCPDGYADNGFIGGKLMWAGSGFLGKGVNSTRDWEEGKIDPLKYGGGQDCMWFFQWAFCTAAASIVSGGVAERVRFPAYACFSFIMSAFIYPVVVCSTWGYGWLETFKKDPDGNPVGGYIDFAGSGVVHLTGGIGALMGATILGRRAGRFDPEVDQEEFDPHSQPLIVLGTFILWFGWCGFNPGSTLGLSDNATALKAAHVMMNTTLSAATGALTVFVLRYFMNNRKYDLGGLCNGILAGLVSITAGCSNVESGSAFFIGIAGGFVYVGSSALVKKAHIDDPVDAFSVHGACGIWGCIAAALLDFGSGVDKHHGWGAWSATSYSVGEETKFMTTGDALAANLSEVAFIIAWSGGLSAITFMTLRLLGVLRLEKEHEELGSDIELTSPRAYRHAGDTWGEESGKSAEKANKEASQDPEANKESPQEAEASEEAAPDSKPVEEAPKDSDAPQEATRESEAVKEVLVEPVAVDSVLVAI